MSGPIVGSLLRQAVFAGDQSAGPPSTSFAERVWRNNYDADPVDPNPTSASSESFEGNRRLLQSVAIYNGIDPTSMPTGRYHTIAYQFDTNAGQYTRETHSGTINQSAPFDARGTVTAWTPSIDPTHWKLDRLQSQSLRATAGGANFSTVTSTAFDSAGYVQTTRIDDGGVYGSLVHDAPPDAHGFPTQETSTHGSSSYTQTLTYAAGSPKTAQWSGMLWKSVDNDIDSTTGLIQTSRDPAGLATTFTYDLFGRPLVTTPPGAEAATGITYDSPTQVTSQTPPSGTPEYAWTRTIADSLGRPLKVQRHMPGGTTAKKITTYDRQGNTVFESEWVLDSVADSSAPGTTYGNFDDFARARTITRADGTTTTISYADPSGSNPNSIWFRVVTVNGVGGGNAVTKYTSDAFGNLIKVTESPDGFQNWDTTYSYNPQNKLTQVNQGNGTQLRNYVYDAFGFLRSETLPEKLNQPVTYSTYDALGNVVTETQPGFLTITRHYDSAGRLTGVLQDPGIRYLTNCYDGPNVACEDGNPNSQGGTYPAGKLTRRIGFNPAGTPAAGFTEDFAYSNAAGRLSSRTTSTGAIAPQTETWIYDLNGHPVQYDHPRPSGTFTAAFAVATSYDHGYPVGVWANGLPTVVSATYQPSGLLASYVTGNNTGQNVTTTIAQDTSSIPRPRQISTSGASQNFDTGIYSYDGAGNITAMGSDSFGYDRLSRLTSAALGGLSQNYTYDQYANLTGTTGVNPRSYSISTQSNRLTNATYDQRGNLQIIGSDTYTWDSLDRIARYQSSGGVDWHYLYSGAGERLVKIPPSGLPSDYVWTFREEANRIATEYVGPTLSRDNVYLGNLLVASYASCASNGPPGWTYYSSDHLGSPRLITDASGTTVDLRKYWP